VVTFNTAFDFTDFKQPNFTFGKRQNTLPQENKSCRVAKGMFETSNSITAKGELFVIWTIYQD
jgi:hypothetical protein